MTLISYQQWDSPLHISSPSNNDNLFQPYTSTCITTKMAENIPGIIDDFLKHFPHASGLTNTILLKVVPSIYRSY